MQQHPELALVSTLAQDDLLLTSLVSQLLEYGVFFTGIGEQRVPDTVPEDLSAHRVLMLTAEAFDAIRDTDTALLTRIETFAGEGFVFVLPRSPGTRAGATKAWYDHTTNQFVSYAIAESGLTRASPAVRRLQLRRPDTELLAAYRERLLGYLARAVGYWNEFHLHWWRAAQALIDAGHADLREPLVGCIRRCCQTLPPGAHHDQLAGLFATVWLREQTGETKQFEDACGLMDRVLALRPRIDDVMAPAGFVDDPLGRRDAARPGAGSLQRRAVMWTEALHMQGATLAALTRATGDLRYLDEGLRLVRMIRRLQQDAGGLVSHCSRGGQPVGLKWSRGVAHAVNGALHMIEEMPAGTACRDEVVDFIASVGCGLRATQDPATGLWRNVLDDTRSRLESSGSACFTMVYGRGIRGGWLDADEFGDMVRRAYEGLKTLHWRGGMVANCRGTGTGDAAYYIGRPQGWGDVPWFIPACLAATAL